MEEEEEKVEIRKGVNRDFYVGEEEALLAKSGQGSWRLSKVHCKN